MKDEQTQTLLALDRPLARDALLVFRTLRYEVARQVYTELGEARPEARLHFWTEDLDRIDH